MDAATLEWSIRHLEGTTYTVDTRFWPAGSTSDAQLVRGALPRIELDPQALLPLLSDPQAYGATLTSRLFADERLRIAFRTARASAETAHVPLRILLRLDASDRTIHSLAWETLQDAERGGFLFQNERVLLARLLDSPDLTPLMPRPRRTVRALIVVAHPSGLEDYGLAPIDITGEIARCRTALGAISLTVLARESTHQAASLTNLRATLRDEPDILYLVAHGTNQGDQPYLWLEHDDGTIDRVAGNEFARSLAELPRRPLLIVLASCQSGGQSHDDGALAAVGPQLAVAGVGAVLGMQGNVTMDTVAGGMPVFFRELLRDGQIERALAAARAAVQGRFDWWLPVLWLRLNDGRLWASAHEREAVSPVGSALHQLRAPVGDFVGRAQEIAQIAAALRRAAESGAVAAISGVRGMGGIGKTELAFVVAQQLAPDFPDAQIVVDLRGASDPLSPVQALQRVIRAFEREARLPDDAAELQTIYRSLLSDKRVLILADNARDAAQVGPLLPPAGCVLLVTSRYRFELEGMVTLDLSTLPAGQAVELLCSLCPRITTEANAIARLCGYLPLALRVVAGLIKRTTRSVAEYVTLLEDTRTRLLRMRDSLANLDVEASLTLSYDTLDPLVQHLLNQLGAFPAHFDRFAAEQIVTIPEDRDLVDLLDILHAANLLEYDPERERYDLHELVRVFVLGRLSDPDAVRERYAIHYMRIAALAEQYYLEGGESTLAGLALFDREHTHIDAGWAWARGQRAEPTIDDLLVVYADVTSHIGELRYAMRRERIPQLEAALGAAQRSGRRVDQGWLLGSLGLAYAALGEVQRAISYHEQDLAIARELGDRYGEGRALGNLGIAYRNLGEVRRAIELHEQSLVIKREVGDRRGVGITLNNLGKAYTALGQVRQAIDSYEQSLVITRELGDRRMEGITLNNLGNAYYSLGGVQWAMSYYEQSLVIAREMNDRRGEGQALGSLGNAYYSLGEVQRGIKFYEQVLVIVREIGDRHGEGQALGNLGIAYYSLGDAHRAIDYYEQQLAITRAIGDRQGEMNGIWNLGHLLAWQGNLARAVALMQIRVNYERSIGYAEAEARAAYVAELRQQLQVAEGASTYVSADERVVRDTALLQRAEAAVARALAEGSAEERAALAERLTVTADAYASGDAAERALAAQLRELLTRLRAGDADLG